MADAGPRVARFTQPAAEVEKRCPDGTFKPADGDCSGHEEAKPKEGGGTAVAEKPLAEKKPRKPRAKKAHAPQRPRVPAPEDQPGEPLPSLIGGTADLAGEQRWAKRGAYWFEAEMPGLTSVARSLEPKTDKEFDGGAAAIAYASWDGRIVMRERYATALAAGTQPGLFSDASAERYATAVKTFAHENMHATVHDNARYPRVPGLPDIETPQSPGSQRFEAATTYAEEWGRTLEEGMVESLAREMWPSMAKHIGIPSRKIAVMQDRVAASSTWKNTYRAEVETVAEIVKMTGLPMREFYGYVRQYPGKQVLGRIVDAISAHRSDVADNMWLQREETQADHEDRPVRRKEDVDADERRRTVEEYIVESLNDKRAEHQFQYQARSEDDYFVSGIRRLLAQPKLSRADIAVAAAISKRSGYRADVDALFVSLARRYAAENPDAEPAEEPAVGG